MANGYAHRSSHKSGLSDFQGVRWFYRAVLKDLEVMNFLGD
jgi:hypothetical protein